MIRFLTLIFPALHSFGIMSLVSGIVSDHIGKAPNRKLAIPYLRCSSMPSHGQTLANSQLTGLIFSHVRPFYERAVSNIDPKRSMYRPVQVAHSLFVEGSHTTKNTGSKLNLGQVFNCKCRHASKQISTCTSSKQPNL